jgi:glutamyl-tRNA reductase
MKYASLLMSMDTPLKKHLFRRDFILSATSTTVPPEAKVDSTDKNSGKKKKKQRSTDNLEVMVLGLSHHNAGVEVREKLAIPEADWNSAATSLTEYDSIAEAAVLSTCNRFELYLAGGNQYEAVKDAIDFLHKRAGGSLDQETLRKNLFMLSGEDAIWHLLRVSAGLDSLVVGEGQILAQVKRAFERGEEPESGQSGKVVARMLNTAVSAGKRVRSETGISKGAVSISSAAVEFTALKAPSDCKIKDVSEANIVIIGAGKMARLLLVHLQTQDVKEITIVNRSPERVEELRTEFPDLKINLLLMDKMWDAIRDADVVYPSTAATTTIIDPEPLAECLKGRSKEGGVQFVDISVPRNVHPGCSEVNKVFSYNVDDLKAVVERNTAKRKREMVEAENILKEELSKFRLWQQSLGAIPTIAKLQEKAENLRLEELQKASKKLSNLSPKDLEAVERLSKGIVAKLLHGPMNHLRQQKEGDATRVAIEQVKEAFLLEE